MAWDELIYVRRIQTTSTEHDQRDQDAGLYKNERVIDGPQDARNRIGDIVRNVYKSDTGKTAACISASHIEKDTKKKAPPAP